MGFVGTRWGRFFGFCGAGGCFGFTRLVATGLWMLLTNPSAMMKCAQRDGDGRLRAAGGAFYRGLVEGVFRVIFGLVLSVSGLWSQGLPSRGGDADIPEVVLEGPALESPKASVRVSFRRAMVREGELGPCEQPPIVFEPEKKGQFVWLSTRSGIFLPDEPWELAGVWKVKLCEGLKDAEGRAVEVAMKSGRGAGFFGELHAPNLRVAAAQLEAWDRANLSPWMRVRVIFNAEVILDSLAQGGAFFRREGGVEVPAVAEVLSDEQRNATPGGAAELWPVKGGQAGAVSAAVVLRPASPLPEGGPWRLVIGGTLRAANGVAWQGEPFVQELGNVALLKVERVRTENLVNTGPLVEVVFNFPVAPDITAENAGSFFEIEPEVAGLRWEVSWRSVIARGAFVPGENYQLRIKGDVLGEDGRAFGGPDLVGFRVGNVKPRVYLPLVTGQQLRFGRRELPLRVVNVRQVDFRVLRVPPEKLAVVRQAMKGYESGWDSDEPDEIYSRVDPGDFVGAEPLAERTLTLSEMAMNRGHDVSVKWDEVLPDGAPGVMFLEAEGVPVTGLGDRKAGAQALVSLTDLGVLWKKDSRGLHVNVFSLASGQSVPGVKVRVYEKPEASEETEGSDADVAGSELKMLSEAETGKQGYALLSFSRMPQWLVLEKDGDAEIVGLGEEARHLPVWDYDLPVDLAPWVEEEGQPRTEQRGYLFTDRPVYRPGEVVRLKGFLREDRGRGWELPAGLRLMRLSLFDPSGEEAQHNLVRVGESGEFDAEMILPAGPRGKWRFALGPGESEFHWWQNLAQAEVVIADFLPDAFEVRAGWGEGDSRHSDSHSPGDGKAWVKARYYFGEAVTGGRLKWHVSYEPEEFLPEGFERFEFLAAGEESPSLASHSGETKLDEHGRGVVIFPPHKPDGRPMREVLRVEVTDSGQQTVESAIERRIEGSDFYLGIERPAESGWLMAGQTVPVRVVAVGNDGRPLPRAVPVRAELFWQRVDVVRMQGAGGAVSFQTRQSLEKLDVKEGSSWVPRREGTSYTVEGMPAMEFALPRPGVFLVRVESKDDRGELVRSEMSLFVAGQGEVVWDTASRWRLEVVPDKATYSPGEVAKLFVKNEKAGRAFVSVERGSRILKGWEVDMPQGGCVFEVPLREDFAPNVFVRVGIVRGAQQSANKFPMPEFRHGLCMVQVQRPQDVLSVEVAPLKEDVQPGEEVEVVVRVADWRGQPVPKASVTFWGVDEGILSLVDYTAPDPSAAFQEPIALGVRSGVNLMTLLPENPDDLVFDNKGYLIGGGGREAGQVRLRNQFPGTIGWHGCLRTDAKGEIRIKLMAPDALTKYRLVAVAAAGGSQFGTGEGFLVIRKPLMLVSTMGGYGRVGDRLMARALIQNTRDEPLKVRWSCEVMGGVTGGASEREMHLAAHESGIAEASLEFTKAGVASVLWRAEAAVEGRGDAVPYSDRLRVDLEVLPAAPVFRHVEFVKLSKDWAQLMQNVPDEIVEGQGTVELEVSNTLLAGLDSKVADLIRYPFGCAEQTVSALVPWSLVALKPLLPSVSAEAQKDKETMALRRKRMAELRAPGGGLRFWPGNSAPSVFATAWAAVVSAGLQSAGAEGIITKEDLNWLRDRVRGGLNTQNPWIIVEQVLALYALALQGMPEWGACETLLAQSDVLPEEARYLLALAFLESRETAPGAAVDAATTSARKAAALRLLRVPNQEAEFHPFSGQGRRLALRALAWNLFAPDAPEANYALKGLVEWQRREIAGNTQSAAWFLVALERIEQSRSSKGVHHQGAGRLVVGLRGPTGRETQIAVSSSAKPASVRVIERYSGKWELAQLAMRVVQGQAGYLRAELESTPALALQPERDEGFRVSRSYWKLNSDGRALPPDKWRVGDKVLVKLTVENRAPAFFTALRDFVPSNLEALNPDFRSMAPTPASGNEEQVATYDFSETTATEVRFFTDWLPAGRHTYTYAARVRTAGEAVAPGAAIEEMYRPTRRGVSASEMFSSQN